MHAVGPHVHGNAVFAFDKPGVAWDRTQQQRAADIERQRGKQRGDDDAGAAHHRPHGRRVSRTPSGVPSSSTSAPRQAKSPLVTTPTMPSIWRSSAGASVMRKPVDVEDEVAVVGLKPLAQPRRATESGQPARDLCPGHRDHFDRQRKAAERIDQLALVGDADEGTRDRGDDLFARERATAALDHRKSVIDLVGAVDVDRKLLRRR